MCLQESKIFAVAVVEDFSSWVQVKSSQIPKIGAVQIQFVNNESLCPIWGLECLGLEGQLTNAHPKLVRVGQNANVQSTK